MEALIASIVIGAALFGLLGLGYLLTSGPSTRSSSNKIESLDDNEGVHTRKEYSAPLTIFSLKVIGWLTVIGGFIGFIDRWPASDRQQIPEILYFIAIYHLVAGVVFGTLFLAAAAALDALVRLVNK